MPFLKKSIYAILFSSLFVLNACTKCSTGSGSSMSQSRSDPKMVSLDIGNAQIQFVPTDEIESKEITSVEAFFCPANATTEDSLYQGHVYEGKKYLAIVYSINNEFGLWIAVDSDYMRDDFLGKPLPLLASEGNLLLTKFDEEGQKISGAFSNAGVTGGLDIIGGGFQDLHLNHDSIETCRINF